MKVWALTDGPVREGKYLVVRRDGTIPEWPHFVMGAADPCVPAALKAYARMASERGLDPEFVTSVYQLAHDFHAYSYGYAREAEAGEHKAADPDGGPHRKDLSEVIAMMRGEADVAALVARAQAAERENERLRKVLRQPTPAMKAAGAAVMRSCGVAAAYDMAHECWAQMARAVLGDQT